MKFWVGMMIPFLGTGLGAACVFFMKKEIHPAVEKMLLGFAAGIMTAASVWSLLLPAIQRSKSFGKLAFLPAAVGFLSGILLLMIPDRLATRFLENTVKGQSSTRKTEKRTIRLLLSVTLHNIPEGLAVGVAFAGTGWLFCKGETKAVALAEAVALAVGIGIQNIPEGAIVSLPLKAAGTPRGKAFGIGVLSGAVEPLAAILTLALAGMVEKALPYLLAFAAGAMILVVVEELVPEAEHGHNKTLGTLGFTAGFLIMMILDVALG